jgi:hypothetical protein
MSAGIGRIPGCSRLSEIGLNPLRQTALAPRALARLKRVHDRTVQPQLRIQERLEFDRLNSFFAASLFVVCVTAHQTSFQNDFAIWQSMLAAFYSSSGPNKLTT